MAPRSIAESTAEKPDPTTMTLGAGMPPRPPAPPVTNAAPFPDPTNPPSRPGGGSPNPDMLLFNELVENVLSVRMGFLNQFMDKRRNINDECGYPETGAITAQSLRDLYDREPIAARVVEVMAKESWQVVPEITEDDDPEVKTPFEQDLDNLSKRLRGERSWLGAADDQGSPLFQALLELDILSGIGHYGVLLIGLDDGKPLDQPADGVMDVKEPDARGQAGTDAQYYGIELSPSEYPKGLESWLPSRGTEDDSSTQDDGGVGSADQPEPQRHVLFLRAFDESLVQVTQYEADIRNPRFGLPKQYLITLNDPRNQAQGSGIGLSTNQVRVHWSRVIHLCDTSHQAVSSKVHAAPRMRPVLNAIMDIQKVRGAAAEGYWKSCFTGLSFETHPQLGGDVKIDVPKLKSMAEEFQNGLQKILASFGGSWKTIAPSVVDPTPQITILVQAICIKIGIPVRVFSGSERGELASSQDDESWNDRLRERQTNHITPKIIGPVIDRLIQLGVLRAPKEYFVKWPDLDSLGDKDKAAIAMTITQTCAAYVQGGLETLIPPLEFFAIVLRGLITENETKSILEAAVAAAGGTEGDDTTNPRLRSSPESVDTMMQLMKSFTSGEITEEMLRQQIMLHFGTDDKTTSKLVADAPDLKIQKEEAQSKELEAKLQSMAAKAAPPGGATSKGGGGGLSLKATGGRVANVGVRLEEIPEAEVENAFNPDQLRGPDGKWLGGGDDPSYNSNIVKSTYERAGKEHATMPIEEIHKAADSLKTLSKDGVAEVVHRMGFIPVGSKEKMIADTRQRMLDRRASAQRAAMIDKGE